jgi:hypothetical protein
MIDEIRLFLPAEIETEVFEISQHVYPKELQQALQRAIDRSDGLYDPIYLGESSPNSRQREEVK